MEFEKVLKNRVSTRRYLDKMPRTVLLTTILCTTFMNFLPLFSEL